MSCEFALNESTRTTHDPKCLRVAYVVANFEIGGLERCVAELSNLLDPAFFEPLIICLGRKGSAAHWVTQRGVAIHELHKKDGNDPSVVFRLARTLRSERVDLVHSHNWGTLLEVVLARKIGGVPVHVHAEHGQELADLRVSGLRRWARGRTMRWAFNQTDAVITVGESVRKVVAKRANFPLERIRVIPNGIRSDTTENCSENRGRLRGLLGINDQVTLIGSVGRLAPVKDFGTAISAVHMLVRSGKNVHLVLLGTGPEQGKLDTLVQTLGLQDRIHLVGYRRDVQAWLEAMDIYVNSSLSEAMSLGILEAMASGLPIVATDVGENARLVTEPFVCGLVVPPGSPNTLGSAVEKLVGDEQLQVIYRRNAKLGYRAEYQVKTMVQRYASLYRTLTAAGWLVRQH